MHSGAGEWVPHSQVAGVDRRIQGCLWVKARRQTNRCGPVKVSSLIGGAVGAVQ